jgi:phosphate starvation-inducible PhoH-like protein
MGERVSASRVVIVDDAAVMPDLLGTADAVIKEVERAFPSVDVLVRGNHISLTGDDADVAACAAAIEELRSMLAAGVSLTPEVARETTRMLRDARSAVSEASDGSNPQSRPAAVLARSILSSRGRTIRPKTEGQAQYVSAIERNTITFGIGPAGTGKTYLAMAQAVAALQGKQVSRIILTRPAVEAGERLGFLPGTLSEKIDPYLRPLYDALHDMVDPESIPRLIEAGTIEVAPLAYMRGRTLNDAFIILDEAQNTTREQMKMFLTRLGFGSTMVVTGDITQVDLPGGTDSGLRAARDILRGVDDIAFCELGANDVVRHRLVSDIIVAYAQDEATRSRPRHDGQQRRFSKPSDREDHT